MAPDAFRFAHQLRVRWAEVDMQSVVFNGNYMTYFDVAFTEYWRATGLPGPIEQAQSGYELFARKASIEYHASARFDDLLDIYVRCGKLGRSSLLVLLEIHRPSTAPGEAEHLVSGELVYVYANARAKKSSPMPQRWREILRAFEKTPPET